MLNIYPTLKPAQIKSIKCYHQEVARVNKQICTDMQTTKPTAILGHIQGQTRDKLSYYNTL